MNIRRASAADHARIERLLVEADLTTEGVAEWIDRFWIAEDDAGIGGVAGIELHAGGCLLRSVAVRPDLRSTGLGRALVERALESARADGARDAYLLTLTAERWFPRLGFRQIGREEVPAGVRQSREFTGACPDSAAVMMRSLS